MKMECDERGRVGWVVEKSLSRMSRMEERRVSEQTGRVVTEERPGQMKKSEDGKTGKMREVN